MRGGLEGVWKDYGDGRYGAVEVDISKEEEGEGEGETIKRGTIERETIQREPKESVGG